MQVQVLNMAGQPINTTSPRKARGMLTKGIAEIVQKYPLVIRLKVPTGPAKK